MPRMRTRTLPAPGSKINPCTRATVASFFSAVVVLGAWGAWLLSDMMMNEVALVGGWMMITLAFVYGGVRANPSVGIPMLAGWGVGAIVVASFGGMTMLS